ncbi:MAG: hypothetical protein LC722_08110 [Actinobacteria bacterium]|nr:hypothetical protein [Actinomycetota bacterium]
MNALLFIGFVLLIVLVGYLSWRAKVKRRQALGVFARQYGLEYSPEDPFGLLDYAFNLFTKGEGQGIENVVWGEWQGCSVREADYWYYTESTDSNGHKSRSYHHYSVAIIDVGLDLPEISVAPEGVFSRLADHVGLRDIDFESEEFNLRFNVRAPDREYAFKIVDARMMRFLLTTQGMAYETLGPWALIYCNRRKPTELIPLFGAAKGFNDNIPRLVRTEFALDAGRKEITT